MAIAQRGLWYYVYEDHAIATVLETCLSSTAPPPRT